MQMDEVVKGIGTLQCKSNYQACMVEAFRGLLAKGDIEEKAMLKKFATAKEA